MTEFLSAALHQLFLDTHNSSTVASVSDLASMACDGPSAEDEVGRRNVDHSSAGETASTASSQTSPSSSFTSSPGPEADVIILQSSDDVTFITSRSLLIKHSTFFADLLSIPTRDDTLTDIIPLPTATSAGLGLILGVLKSLEGAAKENRTSMQSNGEGEEGPARAPRQFWTYIDVDDLTHVANAAAIADAYDIPSFASTFVPPTVVHQADQPFLAFATAAIARADTGLTRLARSSLSREMPLVPRDIRRMLDLHAPDALDRLLELHNRYAVALGDLRDGMTTSQPVSNGFNGYAVRCRGDKKGYRSCRAYDGENDWGTLRARAASDVFDHVTSWSCAELDYSLMRATVEQTVPCHKCTTRLHRTFNQVVRRYWAVCHSF